MATNADDKLVKFGTVKKMFTAFAQSITGSGYDSDVMPEYDKQLKRYDNDSIVRWIDSFADGLVYGVTYPKYDTNPTPEAVKTDANEGLVLEPSTLTKVGRNDYIGKKLFMCPRVNGGVDSDGMPYVTAIEGIDTRFNPYENNTFVLTPIYYQKIDESNGYQHLQYCDSPKSDFQKSFTQNINGRTTPFYLRACYLDSDGNLSSLSGKIPSHRWNEEASYHHIHSCKNDFNVCKQTDTHLTYLANWDVLYWIQFMQLMFGVKAPRSVVSGTLNLAGNLMIKKSTEGKYVYVGTTDWKNNNAYVDGKYINRFTPNRYINVGTSTSTGNINCDSIASSCKITRVEHTTETDPENSNQLLTKIYLDCSENLVVTANKCFIMTVPYKTGCLDEVKGTFGSFEESNLKDNLSPFKFQNIELGLGLSELIQNYTTWLNNSTMMVSIFNEIQNRDDPYYYSNRYYTSLPTTSGYYGDLDLRVDHTNTVPPVVTNSSATSTTGYMDQLNSARYDKYGCYFGAKLDWGSGITMFQFLSGDNPGNGEYFEGSRISTIIKNTYFR